MTVTGITGYVGSLVGLILLREGKYRVRGTVRSVTNAAKLDPIKNAYGEELFGQLELVEADLLENASMARAIAGSTHVCHVASPFILEEPDDEMVLIRPAVDGTLSVLRAAQANGVHRVCMTSSLASVVSCNDENGHRPEVFNESHFSDPNFATIGKYEKSKTLAELAAWDFVEKQSQDGHKVEHSTICPGYIAGPTLIKTDFTSGKATKMFLENSFPGGIPRIQFSVVDVRDVAQAHVNSLERDEAQGKRFIVANESLWMREIGQIL